MQQLETPTPPSSLRGMRVGITGGTSGLGRALVQSLRKLGAEVAFVARNPERVAQVAHETGAHGIRGDVAQKADIHPIALQMTAALDGLDVLINNASSLGPVPLAPLADTECEELEEALATNVTGPFRLTRAVLGALAASAREGRSALVINISSDAAVNAYPGWGAYGASKAALAHMTRIWHEEARELGIGFWAVDPGDMDTPLHALALPDSDPGDLESPEDAAREIIEGIEARASLSWAGDATRGPAAEEASGTARAEVAS